MRRSSLLAAAFALAASKLFAAETLSFDEQEKFLRTAKILNVKTAKKGVTGARDATLSDGKITHLASIQTIDEANPVLTLQDGTTELNFRDTFVFNIAAWKL